MFDNKRVIFGAFIALLIVAGSVATKTPAVRAEAGDLEYALDCDLATAGVQSACSVPIGTPRLDIGVTVRKVTPGDSDIMTFTFDVVAEEKKFRPRAGVDANLDSNPDFNDPGTGDWRCDLGRAPQSDQDPDPSIANSTLGCWDLSSPYVPLIGEGGELLLAVVHYDLTMPGTGTANFNLLNVAELTTSGVEDGSCNPVIAEEAACIGATVTVYDPLLVPGFMWAVDCDLVLPGVQDVCGVPLGTAAKDVGTVVLLNGGGDKKIGMIYMQATTNQLVLDPKPNPVPHVDRDANPDWNQAPFLAAQPPAQDQWACSPFYPIPDANSDPGIASSAISCFNAEVPGSPVLNDDGNPLLAFTIHYNIAASSPASAVISFDYADASDENVVVLGDCTNDPIVPCYPATVYITGALADTDGDGRNNVIDNCIEIANFSTQNNNDRIVDLPPSKAFDDFTRVHGDNYGDVCDADDDNDGLRDGRESEGPPCLTASAATDPMKPDTDGDRAFDGAECLLGFDPASAASTPPFVFPLAIDMDRDGVPDSMEPGLGMDPGDVDTDNDAVNDGVELKYYNGDPARADTDGDGCSDGKEVASVNADNVVNAIDLGQVASAFGNVGAPQYLVEFDMNKDGSISSLDLGRVAVQFGSC